MKSLELVHVDLHRHSHLDVPSLGNANVPLGITPTTIVLGCPLTRIIDCPMTVRPVPNRRRHRASPIMTTTSAACGRYSSARNARPSSRRNSEHGNVTLCQQHTPSVDSASGTSLSGDPCAPSGFVDRHCLEKALCGQNKRECVADASGQVFGMSPPLGRVCDRDEPIRIRIRKGSEARRSPR